MGEIVRAFPAGQQVDARPVVQMREAREVRAPLADIDAERAVLGACLLDSDRQGHMLESLSKRLRSGSLDACLNCALSSMDSLPSPAIRREGLPSRALVTKSGLISASSASLERNTRHSASSTGTKSLAPSA